MRTAPVLIHLDHSLRQRREVVAREARLVVRGDLSTPIMEGAVERMRPPENKDRVRHHGRAASDTMEQRNQLGGQGAHCRADDRRHGLVAQPCSP